MIQGPQASNSASAVIEWIRFKCSRFVLKSASRRSDVNERIRRTRVVRVHEVAILDIVFILVAGYTIYQAP